MRFTRKSIYNALIINRKPHRFCANHFLFSIIEWNIKHTKKTIPFKLPVRHIHQDLKKHSLLPTA